MKDLQELGDHHPSVAISLNNLAGLYESMERYEEALPLYERTVAIAEEVLGAEHPDTALYRRNYDRLRAAMA